MADLAAVKLAVQNRHVGEDMSVLEVAASVSFLWGTLHTVPLRPREGAIRLDYVWDEPGEPLRVFVDFREVITFVSVAKTDILGRAGRLDISRRRSGRAK